jgi:hypothetical protein
VPNPSFDLEYAFFDRWALAPAHKSKQNTVSDVSLRKRITSK